MKILVGSLQYKPIYKSHCLAFGKQCEKLGHDVKYIFSNHYRWMLSNETKEKTFFIGNTHNILTSIRDVLNPFTLIRIIKILKSEKPDCIYLHNFHPFFNFFFAKQTKKNKCRYIQHIHEPFYENKKLLQKTMRCWTHLFEFFQEMLLSKTDVAVLSSYEALRLFNKRYKKFTGKKEMIPLIYEDLGLYIKSSQRKYITFIGPPVRTKGPETFLNLVDYSEKNKLGLNFVLISRLPIKEDKYYKYENLEIFHKNNISDEEIGYYLVNSLMTCTPYTNARQSSVVLTSYMYGTPVLSTDINAFREIVTHKETGYLVNVESDIKEWINGAKFIISNIDRMSMNCREYFIKKFSEENWPYYFYKLLYN